MEHLGKGLGTVGIWSGAAFFSNTVVGLANNPDGAGTALFVLFVLAIGACFATAVIWSN